MSEDSLHSHIPWIPSVPGEPSEYGYHVGEFARRARDVREGKVAGLFPKEGGDYAVVCAADVAYAFIHSRGGSADGLLAIAILKGWTGAIPSGNYPIEGVHRVVGMNLYAFRCPIHLRKNEDDWILYEASTYDVLRGALVSAEFVDSLESAYERRARSGQRTR